MSLHDDLATLRRCTDLLKHATRQKRTCELVYDTEPAGGDLETVVLAREQLRAAFDDPVLAQRRAWRDSKRRQTARRLQQLSLLAEAGTA